MTASTTDADIDEFAAQVAYVIHNTAPSPWPYPHLRMQPLLPPALYESLSGLELASDTLVSHVYGVEDTKSEQNRFSLDYSAADLSAGRVTVPELERAYRVLSHSLVRNALLGRFRDEVAKRYAKLQVTLDTAFYYIEDSTGYELLPHTDTDSKAVTLLIYLAREGDNPELGTHLYVPRNPQLYDVQAASSARYRREAFYSACSVPFRPNAAVAFAPSKRTFHGVPAVHHGDRRRRLIQFQLLARPAVKPA